MKYESLKHNEIGVCAYSSAHQEADSLNLGVYPHRFSQKRSSLKAPDSEAEIEFKGCKVESIIFQGKCLEFLFK